MNIAITGGGTGGHLAVARALAKRLSKSHNVIFIGSNNGQDKKWFKEASFFNKKFFLQSSGVVNKKGFKKFASLLNILNLSLKCKKIFKENKIDFVISVGGYSSAPASICTIINKIPLFLHEQNAKIGKLNSLLKPFAKGFYSSYFEPKFNYITDEKFFLNARVRKNVNKILFLGGSQGASFINKMALNLAPKLHKNNIKIIHQCGIKEYEMLNLEYKKLGIDVDLFAFSSEIEKKMASADLCISRSGASSLWELCANNLPAIFVPYPSAASDHQFFNAKFLLDDNLCILFREDEIDDDKILKAILNYDVFKISSALNLKFKNSGTDEIIDDIFKRLQKF